MASGYREPLPSRLSPANIFEGRQLEPNDPLSARMSINRLNYLFFSDLMVPFGSETKAVTISAD